MRMLRQFIFRINRTVNPANYITSITRLLSTDASPKIDDTQLEQIHIDEAVKIVPTLAHIQPETWHRTHKTFVNHGLMTTSFLRIVTGNPAVLKRPRHQLIEAIEYWRSCQFGEKFMHLLLTKYPEMLDVTDKHHLLTRITFLKQFVGTNKNVWQILMNCPNLMEQSQNQIENKMKYLTQEMRIEVPEIVKSEALSHPLDLIRTRHVFLVRLGSFKPRSPKVNPDEPTKNNRLYQITDTSEKKFATKICHVSLEEFEAFKELYERELKRKSPTENTEED